MLLPHEGKDHGYLAAGFARVIDEENQEIIEEGLVYRSGTDIRYDLLFQLEKDENLRNACILGLKKVKLVK